MQLDLTQIDTLHSTPYTLHPRPLDAKSDNESWQLIPVVWGTGP